MVSYRERKFTGKILDKLLDSVVKNCQIIIFGEDFFKRRCIIFFSLSSKKISPKLISQEVLEVKEKSRQYPILYSKSYHFLDPYYDKDEPPYSLGNLTGLMDLKIERIGSEVSLKIGDQSLLSGIKKYCPSASFLWVQTRESLLRLKLESLRDKRENCELESVLMNRDYDLFWLEKPDHLWYRRAGDIYRDHQKIASTPSTIDKVYSSVQQREDTLFFFQQNQGVIYNFKTKKRVAIRSDTNSYCFVDRVKLNKKIDLIVAISLTSEVVVCLASRSVCSKYRLVKLDWRDMIMAGKSFVLERSSYNSASLFVCR